MTSEKVSGFRKLKGVTMDHFPDFMKNPVNKVAPKSQYTQGIEGYVFDGADGSQMAFWTHDEDAESKEHFHDYEEYIVVVQGQVTLLMEDDKIVLKPGDEFLIPKAVKHSNEVFAGTRAIYAFGGKRVERESHEIN